MAFSYRKQALNNEQPRPYAGFNLPTFGAVSIPDAMTNILYQSNIKSLPLHSRGKVRENYEVGRDKLLMVATDRLSAFDVVLDQAIPRKGVMLTQLSVFWFDRLKSIIPNHLISQDVSGEITSEELNEVHGRAILVERLKPLPFEAVVRGYLSGSGWREYNDTSQVCGVRLPGGLRESEKLPCPIFTPATKALAGSHDQNIRFDELATQVGGSLAEKIRDISLELYTAAVNIAQSKGIIVADTKFEFGLDPDGQLKLMDEVLTPDSSRFWPTDAPSVGVKPISFDKQYVRDWLASATVKGELWNKRPPAPLLPEEVISHTAERYREAVRRITS